MRVIRGSFSTHLYDILACDLFSFNERFMDF